MLQATGKRAARADTGATLFGLTVRAQLLLRRSGVPRDSLEILAAFICRWTHWDGDVAVGRPQLLRVLQELRKKFRSFNGGLSLLRRRPPSRPVHAVADWFAGRLKEDSGRAVRLAGRMPASFGRRMNQRELIVQGLHAP